MMITKFKIFEQSNTFSGCQIIYYYDLDSDSKKYPFNILKQDELIVIPLYDDSRNLLLKRFKIHNIKYKEFKYNHGYIINTKDEYLLKHDYTPIPNFTSFDNITKKELEIIISHLDTRNREWEYSTDEAIDTVLWRLKTKFPIGFKNIPDTITLYRYISMLDKRNLKKKDFGIHFTTDKKWINDDFIDSIMANKDGFILEITTNKENIDITQTIMANLEYPNESEITLKPNSKCDIINIEKYKSTGIWT